MAAKKTVEVKPESPRRNVKHNAQCRRAIKTLIEWADGNKAELARMLGTTRVAVQRWETVTGAVGRESAYVATLLPGCPLTFEQIRPDIVNLPEDRMKALRAFAKDCERYIKQRDKDRTADAKAAEKLLKAA